MKAGARGRRAACAWLATGLLHVALASTGPAQPASEAQGSEPGLDEIVVTGSHIHGVESAGSKRITIGRDQIDASGYGRIEDVMATVSQNFNRVNGAVRQGRDVDNLNRGAEVQLRGLGAGTTLTLVNGQREAASGYQGSFVDISSIPAAAVDHIDILPEVASALYGSDAIGGVVNVVLRRDFNGLEVRVRGSTADGDATERTVAALWGRANPRGHLFIGLQYDDSAALECRARAFCATNGDFRSRGGSDLRNVGGNPGTLLDPVSLAPVAAIPRGQDGMNLSPAQLIPGAVNYTDQVTGNQLLPRQILRSAFASASFDFSAHWDVSIDGRYSSRSFTSTFAQPPGDYLIPAENAFNHLGGGQTMGYDFNPDLGRAVDSGRTDSASLTAGLTGALPRNWRMRASATYSRVRNDYREANLLNLDAVDAALADGNPDTALNIFGDGSHTHPATLATLRGDYRGVNVFSTLMTNLIADGPTFSSPAGPVRLAIGSEFRREHSVGLNIADGPEDRARTIAAAFFELAVPLMATSTASPQRLELSVAGRYDHYSDAGAAANPKLGLSWHPLAGLEVRGNWGTAFRPPPFYWSNPDQIGDGRVAEVTDPQSPSGTTRALQLFGPLPGLLPETATAWSAGADWRPASQPALALSATYFDVDYRRKIRPPGPFAGVFLVEEAQYATLVTRNPTLAQVDAVCRTLKPGICGSETILAILDNRFRNLTGVRTRGVDGTVDYGLDTRAGRWAVGVNGTYAFAQTQQITAGAPVSNVINTVGNPLKVRLTSHLSWNAGPWSVLTSVNHAGAYRDIDAVPARRVASWTTVDLNLGYHLGDLPAGWSRMRCNLGINNLFNRQPPLVEQFDLDSGAWGYDPANASPLGRQVSLQLIKQWGNTGR